MYFSNTRLISLLLALAVLTLSLLWLLSKQTSLSVPTALNAEESLQVAAKEPGTGSVENKVTAIPSLEPAKEAAAPVPQPNHLTSAASKPEPVVAESKKPEPVNSTKTTEVAAIPENLVLSEKELKALSTKDRKRYEKMLDSLHSLREQSTQLSSERQRLEQQMVELERRNQELTKQLEEVRQTTDTVAENKAKP